MVIAFPAAAAAPQPIGALLARCIGFLEGFEDDPAQCVAPLLGQLRAAQQSDLIALPAPPKSELRTTPNSTYTYMGTLRDGGFSFHKCYDRHTWLWQVIRCDQSGRLWESVGWAVVDDFGNLVEVPE